MEDASDCQGVKLLALATVPTGAELFLTVTAPASAPAGTVALSFLADTSLVLAATPPKLTAELLSKPAPLIVTTVPGAPLSGAIAVTDSVGSNWPLLLTVALAVINTIFPGRAPFGTVTSSLVGDGSVKLA